MKQKLHCVCRKKDLLYLQMRKSNNTEYKITEYRMAIVWRNQMGWGGADVFPQLIIRDLNLDHFSYPEATWAVIKGILWPPEGEKTQTPETRKDRSHVSACMHTWDVGSITEWVLGQLFASLQWQNTWLAWLREERSVWAHGSRGQSNGQKNHKSGAEDLVTLCW